MWITKSLIAKLLVWLAAALMPADVLLTGACRCAGPMAGDVQGKAANTLQFQACCCHPGAVCQCCHHMKKTQQSACCKNRAPQFNATQSAVSTTCNCPGGKTPMPQNTLPNSSAKQLINHAYACLASAAAAVLPPDALYSIDQCPSIPATPLERLSTLCRLII
ncbi:MAG: hypothetical protein ABSA77_00480 [Thermoguttaceae bacterium]|jgi:hypothetical protein